jgi:hypothetical protein
MAIHPPRFSSAVDMFLITQCFEFSGASVIRCGSKSKAGGSLTLERVEVTTTPVDL